MSKIPAVLIVDDSPADRFLTQILLEDSGGVELICEVANGQQAYRLFADSAWAQDQHHKCFPPTVIVLDINMPGMNGFEFLEALRKLPEHPRCHVVILSSSDHPQDRERSERYEMVRGYYVKPLSPTEVAELVEQYAIDIPA